MIQKIILKEKRIFCNKGKKTFPCLKFNENQCEMLL